MWHFVYRSYGGENLKNRPPFYSKKVALISFLDAVERLRADGAVADVEVLFVNDGPVSAEVLDLMRPVGRIVELAGVGLRGSYRFALDLPRSLGWSPEDVVWYSEDDYLYRPEAFVALAEAVAVMSDVDYFGLYGRPLDCFPARQGPPPPRGWREESRTVAGVPWRRVLSTASTFGARVGALCEDAGVFEFCMVPHRTMFRDHDTCVVLQGFEPHRWSTQLRNLFFAGEPSGPPGPGATGGRGAPGAPGGRGGPGLRERVRGAVMAPFLLATNLRSHRRPSRRRTLMVTYPNLATHLETGRLAVGTDWAGQATARGPERRRSGRDQTPVGAVLSSTVHVSDPASSAVRSASVAGRPAAAIASSTCARTRSS